MENILLIIIPTSVFMAKQFYFPVKVYYEDTDAGGIVYYANYLKYLERARTEMIYALGLSHQQLEKEYGFLIIVSHCDIAFKKPACFEDHLLVQTELTNVSVVKLEMNQRVYKTDPNNKASKENLMVDAKVILACVNKQGKPIKMHEDALKLFRSCLS